MINGRFETKRLVVAPWRDELGPDGIGRFVVELLTPAVTAELPPDWQGRYDPERAMAWAGDRDAEATVLLVNEGGAPVGVLIVAEAEFGEVRLGYLLIETAWGRGLASELIAGLVRRCCAEPSVRALVGGVTAENIASATVLRRNGFLAAAAPIDGECTYRLDVSGGFHVRPEASSDHAEIRRVVVEAFGSHVEGDLVERIRASPEYVREMSLVAEAEGSVVGHVMISGSLVRHASGERPIALLSPLAVASTHRRRGIGSRLVETACAIADERGEPLVALEGDPTYYGRFGFEHSVRYGLTMPLPEWAPSEAGQVKLLTKFDPGDVTLRGDVVYADAFDGLD